MDKSPLRRIDSPTMQKKYSSASQKFIGNDNNSNGESVLNQVMKKFNFLASNENRTNNSAIKKPNQFERQSQKKAMSPLNPQHKYSDIKGYSVEKPMNSFSSKSIPNKNQSSSKNLGINGKVITTTLNFK